MPSTSWKKSPRLAGVMAPQTMMCAPFLPRYEALAYGEAMLSSSTSLFTWSVIVAREPRIMKLVHIFPITVVG